MQERFEWLELPDPDAKTKVRKTKGPATIMGKRCPECGWLDDETATRCFRCGYRYNVDRNLTGRIAELGVTLPPLWGPFLALRWLAGLIGTLVMAGMTWQTLKVPNTQSATGILYAGMILAFIGELTAALLSAESPFPL